MDDKVGLIDDVSIRLIPKEEWDRPRCGICFARIGNYCAKFGNNVTIFQPACADYDEDISIPL